MPHYFAYGSNLSLEQMANRCPSARTPRRAWLKGYRLEFPRCSRRWKGGVASVTPDPRRSVEGAVYEISSEDLKKLDVCEGVSKGYYRRETRPVQLDDGSEVRAEVYIASPDPDGPFPPSRSYLETILAGVRDHRLSDRLRAELTVLLPPS